MSTGPKGSRVISELEYQRMQAADWATWRGETTHKIDNIDKNIAMHIQEDKDAMKALSAQIEEVKSRVGLIVSVFAAIVVLLNIVGVYVGVYVAWIK